MKKLILLFLLLGFLTGCNESQKKWGKGELPADYVSYFGDGNNARLNKAQNDMLNKHEALILGLNQVKDGKKVHSNGLLDLVLSLQKRVDALEAVDPNEVVIEKIPNPAPETWIQDSLRFHHMKINEIIDRINEK